jgi:DNA replicative helicase MCM subunit Mcm2 (Cdc46/Mcm family)
MQLVQSYYTTLRSARVTAGHSDASSAVLCSLLRLSMASARLHLRSAVAVQDAMLAVRLMEESLAVKGGGEPVLRLGRHMTEMVDQEDEKGERMPFDAYLSVLVENFAPRAAAEMSEG